MIYRPAEDRCAVCLKDLQLPFSDGEAIQILTGLGFRVEYVDILALARAQIGRSAYVRGAALDLAPKQVDCSSFTKWLYAQKGIWLPRLSIDQRDHSGVPVDISQARAGDLWFTISSPNYSWNGQASAVGHVGFVSGPGSIIHGQDTSGFSGVVETDWSRFLANNRGLRRIIPNPQEVLTIICPPGEWAESSVWFRWMLLHHAKAS